MLQNLIWHHNIADGIHDNSASKKVVPVRSCKRVKFSQEIRVGNLNYKKWISNKHVTELQKMDIKNKHVTDFDVAPGLMCVWYIM